MVKRFIAVMLAALALLSPVAVLAQAVIITDPSGHVANVDSSANLKVNCTTGCTATADASFTGSVSSATTLVAATDGSGFNAISFLFTSVGSGNTVKVQENNDNGATWQDVPITAVQTNAAPVNGVSPATATLYTAPLLYRYFRLQVTTYSSGTITVQGSAKGGIYPTNIPLGASSANIGAVSQNGSNWSSNVAQFGGNAVVTGTGAGGVGVPRVTVSNDSSLAANQSVNTNQVAGNATATGNGVTNTGTQRVTISSDSTGQVALATGSNTIGALTANQSVNVAQVAGATTSTAASGVQKVGIVGNAGATVDQAQGSAVPTNGVAVGGGSVAGATNYENMTVKAASVAAAATDTSLVVQPLVGSHTMNTAAAGTQLVGVVGNAGAAFDQAQGSATPANGLMTGGGSVAGGTNFEANTVKAASTAAAATDTSLVVQPLVGSHVMNTAAAGTQLVGITGNAAAALDNASNTSGLATNSVSTKIGDAAGNNRGMNVNASNQATVSVDAFNGTASTAKASGTNAATTDTSLVVAQSPNPNTLCTSVIAVNQTASTDLKTSTNKLHICAIALVSATAQQVSIVEGTGTTCATGTAALWGATTADGTHGMPLAANGGFTQTSDRAFSVTQTTADHLCLLQSGTGLLAGSIWYTDHN